jgi:hypothetical protein
MNGETMEYTVTLMRYVEAESIADAAQEFIDGIEGWDWIVTVDSPGNGDRSYVEVGPGGDECIFHMDCRLRICPECEGKVEVEE